MSPASTTASTPNGPEEIASLRIELCNSDPLIWRELEVQTSITLKVLHDIVQAAMGWLDHHLWEFTISERRYGLPSENDDWDDEPIEDARKVRLRELLKSRKTTIDYLYDFGDCWAHRLIVTKVRPADPALSYPRHIDGQCSAPPDDCGGMAGFYDMLAVLADPSDPNHADIVDWMDEYDPEYNPKRIDVEAIKSAFSRIAKRTKATKTRPTNKPLASE